MRIGFAITRTTAIDPTWTTLHLARAALERGHQVRFVEPTDFEVDAQGQLIARAFVFEPPAPDAEFFAYQLNRRRAPRRFIDVCRLDILLLRASPLDTTLLTFAKLAQQRGVTVINDPAGILLVSHKSWLASLPQAATPTTIVTRSIGSARIFLDQNSNGVVVKPARGSGGRGVVRIYPRNQDALEAAFFSAQAAGDGYVVLQEYLNEAEFGEKRLVWMDGVILGGYLRHRGPGEFRHNLKQGGIATATDVTPAETAAVATISSPLLHAGIRIAGLDVIGGRITEINAMNPGGAFHTDRLSGTDLACSMIARLENASLEKTQEEFSWHPVAP